MGTSTNIEITVPEHPLTSVDAKSELLEFAQKLERI